MIDNGDTSGEGTGADVVHHQLREAILHGRLEAGAVMSQVQLAREFGVSAQSISILIAQASADSGKPARKAMAWFAVKSDKTSLGSSNS